MQDEEPKCEGEPVRRVIAGRVVSGRDPIKQTSQDRELAHQDGRKHPSLGCLQNLLKWPRITAHSMPCLVKPPEAVAIKEHAREPVQPFIAGRAGNARKAW